MYAVIGHELRTPASILKMHMENAARHQNSINKALFNNTLDQLIDVVEKSTASRAHLTLEVSDDGRGISADEIERLFKPYERGEETFNGSGLGLHVCKTIAELMGGNLSLKPNADGGARTRPNGRTIRGPKCSPFRLECSAGIGRQRDP